MSRPSPSPQLDYVCPRTYDASKTDLVFFVVGDWGRAGNDNQRRTARLMADVAGCMPPAFVVSTGDNFYPSGRRGREGPPGLEGRRGGL